MNLMEFYGSLCVQTQANVVISLLPANCHIPVANIWIEVTLSLINPKPIMTRIEGILVSRINSQMLVLGYRFLLTEFQSD
jgi:hypothetical protein